MLDSLLDQLARQRGIGDEYVNYRGDPVTITRESKQAILAAMHEYDARRWESMLPPVAVVHPGRIDVRVAVPADSLDRTLEWIITLESGGSRAGRIRAGELGEVERAEVAGRWQTRRALWVPADVPPGYHDLQVALDAGAAARCRLVVAPQTCYEPPVLEAGGS
jgi:hypothetical protein